jgi:hypothetical protein
LGVFDFFRKDEVLGSKVLVCGLDPRFEELMTADSQIYKRFYPSTVATLFSSVLELHQALASQQYDVVHLFCDVPPNGVFTDQEGNRITGTELLEKSCESNVKLLWIASNNQPDRYINGFNARGKRINLVMTIDRSESNFSNFLDKLLFRMFYGDTMPVAWNDLSPQVPGHLHSDSPSCIFFAGRGGVRLR